MVYRKSWRNEKELKKIAVGNKITCLEMLCVIARKWLPPVGKPGIEDFFTRSI